MTEKDYVMWGALSFAGMSVVTILLVLCVCKREKKKYPESSPLWTQQSKTPAHHPVGVMLPR